MPPPGSGKGRRCPESRRVVHQHQDRRRLVARSRRRFAEAVEIVGADKIQLIEKESEGTDAQANETAIRAMLEEGCEIIFATSWFYGDGGAPSKEF